MATMSINEEVKLLRNEVRELREILNEVLTHVSKKDIKPYPSYPSHPIQEDEDEEEDEENEEDEERYNEEKQALQQAEKAFLSQCMKFCDKDSNGMFNIGGISVSRLRNIQEIFKQTGEIRIPSKLFHNTPENISKIKSFMNHFVFA